MRVVRNPAEAVGPAAGRCKRRGARRAPGGLPGLLRRERRPAHLRGLRVAHLRLVALALAIATVGAGCGGEPDPRASEGAGIGFFGGVPLRRATCAEWNDADVQARLAVIDDLEVMRSDQITGRGIRGQGSVLDRNLAYDLFQSRCQISNSDSFLLYKLYGFAAGFAGTAP